MGDQSGPLLSVYLPAAKGLSFQVGFLNYGTFYTVEKRILKGQLLFSFLNVCIKHVLKGHWFAYFKNYVYIFLSDFLFLIVLIVVFENHL